jgi:two-component system chemotaxis response regulator CheY
MAKILTVDDSVSIRKLVIHSLAAAGHQVSEAKDGAEGLGLARREQFQVVLSDVNMPVMDGFTFVAKVRGLDGYRFTPILMLTTENSVEKMAAAKSAGATGWIVKPFNPDQLVVAIRKVCG